MDDGILESLGGVMGVKPARLERHLEYDPQGEKKSTALRLLLDFYDGDTTEETWRNSLKGTDLKQGIVVLVESEKVLAACIYEMATQGEGDEAKRVVLLKTMKGVSDSLRIRWKFHMTEFEQFARDQKCDYIIIQGRPAWLRLDWKVLHVWVGRSLTENNS